MGTRGRGILSDDFARDVYDEYLERYDDGADHPAIFHLLEVVGRTKLRWRDPTKGGGYANWNWLMEDIFNQDAWDRAH